AAEGLLAAVLALGLTPSPQQVAGTEAACAGLAALESLGTRRLLGLVASLAEAAWAGSGSSSLPSSAVVYEVGPRDGLQNERLPVSTAIKATSFISPKRVPQLADSAQVMSLISRRPGVIYPVLTPNMQGFESAVQAGATTVAVFGSASEAFSQANINC
ncbi:hydroxymethylglutaryl-CoA lyase, partial [Haematococcus lacustris]